MIEREEYLRKVMEKTVRNTVQTLLRTEEFSKRFLTRPDISDVDKEIEKISNEIMDAFILELKKNGYLDGSKEPTQKEFESIFKSIIDKYFGEKSENGSTSQ